MQNVIVAAYKIQWGMVWMVKKDTINLGSDYRVCCEEKILYCLVEELDSPFPWLRIIECRSPSEDTGATT
jgi:hypothetical protein